MSGLRKNPTPSALRASSAPGETGAPWISGLAAAIETEVVPRLAVGNAPTNPLAHSDVPSPTSVDITALTHCLVASDVLLADGVIDQWQTAGLDFHHLCLELLAPAAAELGEQWADDRISFGDVTIGVCRLYSTLRRLASAAPAVVPREASALVVPSNTDQHRFGAAMVNEFLRLAGWQVKEPVAMSRADLLDLVSEQHLDVLGLSIGNDTRLTSVGDHIRRLRKASRNPHLGVLVGGPCIAGDTRKARLMGADATACDAASTLPVAERMLRLLSQR